MKIKIYVTLLLIIFFGLSYYLYLIKFSNDKLVINKKVKNNETTIFDKNENANKANKANKASKDINYEEKNEDIKLKTVEKNKGMESMIIDNNSYTGESLRKEEDLYIEDKIDNNNLTEILAFSQKPYGMDIDFGNGYYYENDTYYFELRNGEYFIKIGEKKIEIFINDNGENIIRIIENGKKYEILNYGTFSRSPHGVFNIKKYENGDLLLAEREDTHYPKNFIYYTADKGFLNINNEVNKLVSDPFPGNTIKKLGRNLIIESLYTFDVGKKDSYKILLNLNNYTTKLITNK